TQMLSNDILFCIVLLVCLKRTHMDIVCQSCTINNEEETKEHRVKYMSNTPSHRKHANSQCNCRQCKQFDYANTVNLSPVEQPSCLAVVELVGAVDSETCERYDYYMVSPRKPIPIHKERKVKYALTTSKLYRKHDNKQCTSRN